MDGRMVVWSWSPCVLSPTPCPHPILLLQTRSLTISHALNLSSSLHGLLNKVQALHCDVYVLCDREGLSSSLGSCLRDASASDPTEIRSKCLRALSGIRANPLTWPPLRFMPLLVLLPLREISFSPRYIPPHRVLHSLYNVRSLPLKLFGLVIGLLTCYRHQPVSSLRK